MSPAADKFDEGLRALNLGRRFFPATPNAFGGLFSLVEPIAREMRDQLIEEIGTIPEILGGVNDDSAFDAFAAPLPDGEQIIAVNYGTLMLIHDLVHRLFCIPEFFPWVGDPAKEDRSRQFHPTSDDAQTYMRTFIANPRSAIPKDPIRKQAAVFLIPLAVTFVVAHEFRHITGGHLGWLAAQSGRVSISEALGMRRDPSTGLLFQALEMDADAFAMYYILAKAFAVAETTTPEDTPPPLRSMIATPMQALHTVLACALVAIGTFFRQPGPPEDWSSFSHPPSGIRHGMNMWGAGRALTQLGQNDLRSSTLSNREWTANFANFTFRYLAQRLGNPERRDELLLQFGPRGQQHLIEVVNVWGSIQKAVEGFAYRGAPAAGEARRSP